MLKMPSPSDINTNKQFYVQWTLDWNVFFVFLSVLGPWAPLFGNIISHVNIRQQNQKKKKKKQEKEARKEEEEEEEEEEERRLNPNFHHLDLWTEHLQTSVKYEAQRLGFLFCFFLYCNELWVIFRAKSGEVCTPSRLSGSLQEVRLGPLVDWMKKEEEERKKLKKKEERRTRRKKKNKVFFLAYF